MNVGFDKHFEYKKMWGPGNHGELPHFRGSYMVELDRFINKINNFLNGLA